LDLEKVLLLRAAETRSIWREKVHRVKNKIETKAYYDLDSIDH